MGKRSSSDSAGGEKANKKTKVAEDDEEEEVVTTKSYAERCVALSPIAEPLADEKMTKKLYKLVRKATAAKGIRRGVKEVVKAVRKGGQGLCIIAGDIYPVDVVCHLPVFCEEKEVTYVYVPSKQDLGFSALTKRPTSCVLVTSKKGGAGPHQDLLDKLLLKLAPSKKK